MWPRVRAAALCACLLAATALRQAPAARADAFREARALLGTHAGAEGGAAASRARAALEVLPRPGGAAAVGGSAAAAAGAHLRVSLLAAVGRLGESAREARALGLEGAARRAEAAAAAAALAEGAARAGDAAAAARHAARALRVAPADRRLLLCLAEAALALGEYVAASLQDTTRLEQNHTLTPHVRACVRACVRKRRAPRMPHAGSCLHHATR